MNYTEVDGTIVLERLKQFSCLLKEKESTYKKLFSIIFSATKSWSIKAYPKLKTKAYNHFLQVQCQILSLSIRSKCS